MKYSEVKQRNSDMLYKKMEKKFESEYEIPLLEERKKKLEQVRSLRKGV